MINIFIKVHKHYNNNIYIITKKMSYNFLDVLPDDIFSKILSFNIDIIEQEIFKVELSLLKFMAYTDDSFNIDVLPDDNDNKKISYINIGYDDISYCMDEFLLEINEYKKICIVSTFSINGNDTIYSLISSVMFNATYYDILKKVSYLNKIKNSFLAINDAKDEIDENHCFLETLNVVSRLSLRGTKKICHKLPKIKDVVFLEAYLGS